MDNGMSLESITGSQAKMKYYSTVINTDAEEDKGYMDFDSYLKVLAAQMSNQDFNDPMSDAEFMQQMASYSMMEAIGQMNTQSQISYATSLVGKAVTVEDGTKVTTGIVESVVISDGKYSLLVNGGKYTTDQITDVVDTDNFNKSREFIGRNVSIKDGDDILPGGKISDVVFKDGNAYAVIGKEVYDLASLLFEDEEEESAQTEEDFSSAYVNASNATSALYYDGQSVVGDRGIIFDEFEEELFDYNDDSADKAAGTSSGTGRESVTVNDIVMDFDPASLMSASSMAPAYASVPEKEYTSASVSALTAGVQDTSETERVLYASGRTAANEAAQNIPFEFSDEDFVTASVINIAENKSFADSNYYTPTYGSNSYYGGTAVVPNRAFAEDYPEEAAIANQRGTKMYDIRYINNTSINSIIKKDVIGYASDGKPFTDIGYSGKGRLGEVVTWADGSQRVELISRKGSSWFTTSGRFTLDQICDPNMKYTEMGKELTPFERIIRAASKEYTPEERYILDQYSKLYLQSATNYNAANAANTTNF